MVKMIEQCDIMTENYIPGKLAKYGLSFDDVKEINPNIIYASLSGNLATFTIFAVFLTVDNCPYVVTNMILFD